MYDSADLNHLAALIRDWGRDLGFQQVGISDCDVTDHAARLQQWLDAGYHADMEWMRTHQALRADPPALEPGTLRVISARMDYLPPDTEPVRILKDSRKAYVSRYALGRDYHKLIRKRLARLGEQINRFASEHDWDSSNRAFTDSAPVLERGFGEKAGLGWIGKNCMLLNSGAGSWFFLGELFVNLPLPVDQSEQPDRCGTCSACLKVCPTDAFIGPYQLDASRCISYLTIEYDGVIPEELREPMGNRIFGCDDCQAICPWNRFAKPTGEGDFHPRHGLGDSDLLQLFGWSEQEFLDNTAGSAIRRSGYERWRRNLAVALGNAEPSAEIIEAVRAAIDEDTPLVAEHLRWALSRLQSPRRRKRKIRRNR
ncbi:tRNA epoxyqueuosine(34) reductase QueG [Biformimicrobium ophioploci]|uniref:Epoxyqueuosine reductase n=1 Tax=Biformimicrobium ophioploci TaxID=3036711 RepID=A0ABQ6LV33_9GAMM|nr:tRNA epoxyqueuosine(34) reductase QueG [Microbulbifer sp. NKW57]GMG85887.1 tRNA epoxyqueuosine(34) reductase QueG [Microbulbifer sp. NKW57]